MFEINRTTSDNIDFKNLVALLDADLQESNGEQHSFFSQYNKLDAIKNVVMCYDDSIAVGCGAFKKFNANTIEIKRMFVQPQFRKQGVASIILKELEQWATEIGYQQFILETAKNRPEAIALYKKRGYTVIPNYGQYEGVEESICFRKTHSNRI